MVYKLVYTRTAAKDIEKLDPVAKRKLKAKKEAFSKKPLFYARKLIDTRIGTYRWRVGNYRIVFDIDKDKIVILRVGHRKEIYR